MLGMNVRFPLLEIEREVTLRPLSFSDTTMQTSMTTDIQNQHHGLESFLRDTRRRLWFLYGMSVVSTAVSALLLWGALLLAWPFRPTEGTLWWVGLVFPAYFVGRGTLQLWRLSREHWQDWRSTLSPLAQSFGIGFLLLWTWLIPSPPVASLYIYWWTGAIVAAGYLLWQLAQLIHYSQTQEIATLVEQWNPETKGYLTALELARELPTLSKSPLYSSDLSEARIEQVEQTMDGLAPVNVVPSRDFEERASTLLLVGFLFFGSILIAPQWTTKMLGMLLIPPLPKMQEITRSEQKIVVADLVITYQYPAYTKRRPRTIHNTDGSLFALKGTEVHIRARALEPTERAAIVVNQTQVIPLKIGADGHSVTGTLNLLAPGFYRFRFATKSGALLKGPQRSIRLSRDQKPKVKLLYPKKNIEVRERQSLPIVYRFKDDFGAAIAYLIYRNTTSKRFNKPQKVLLKRYDEQPREKMERTSWTLQSLPFGPGDRVSYFIEIHDNDSIGGPNIGRSATRFLKIFSPLEQHDKLLVRQEKLLAQMVHFMGDLLVAPKINTTTIRKLLKNLHLINTKGEELLGSFRRLLPKMREDTMAKTYTLIAMENLLFRLKRRHLQRHYITQRLTQTSSDPQSEKELIQSQRIGEIPAQEDDVYAFTMLLNRQRLDVLQDLAKQLTQSQNRVQELLEKYRQKRDPETKKALMRELQRLERLIRQINARMQKLNRQIPDEYLNMQAFKNRSSMNKLKRLKEMLKKDNLEDAAKELSRLARNIERMVSQMERYSKEAGGQALQRMAAAMRQMMQQINQLEQKQQRLSQRTQNVQRKVAKRMRKALKKQLKAMLKKQLKRVKKIKQELKSMKKNLGLDIKRYNMTATYKRLERRTQELGRMLKLGDVFESLQSVKQFQRRSLWLNYSLRNIKRFFRYNRKHRMKAIQRSHKSLNNSREIARKIHNDLEKIFPSPKPFMTPQDRQHMRRYSRQQEQLRRETRRLQRKLQRMSRRMPMFKPSMQKGLKQAAGEMNGAKGQLKQNSPRPAFTHQQKAIAKLRSVRKQMSKSMQRRKGKRGRRGKKGRNGRRGTRYMDVKIPDPSAHKAPKALRQDILDAMKEKFPHKYKERVHRYYEKLAK